MNIISFKIRPNSHKYKSGDKVILVDMEEYPEYNGTEVTIVSPRADDVYGKCYYIEGEIDGKLDWIYEFRLKAL